MLRNKISVIYQKCLKLKFKKKIRSYKNIHQGKRCFLIGNGPSLRVSDLEKLNGEYTFASNKIFKVFDKTDWRPTYYMSQDGRVITLIKDKFLQMSECCKACFFHGSMYRIYQKELKNRKNVVFFNLYRRVDENNEFPVESDLTKGVCDGYTVTFSMIQFAIYMGFKEIYLLGVDNSYKVSSTLEGKLIEDKNINSYFYKQDADGSDFPGLTAHAELAYRAAERYAKKHGIKIYNATRGGKLEEFERVNFDEIIK